MTIEDDYTDGLMRRCQTEGYDLKHAKTLLAECYGHIGWLSNELRKAQGIIKLSTMVQNVQRAAQQEEQSLQPEAVIPQRLTIPSDSYRDLCRRGEASLSAVFKSLDKSQNKLAIVDADSGDETMCEFTFTDMGFGIGDGVLHLTSVKTTGGAP